MINNLSVVNVYEKKNLKSKIVTQLLYGDTFKRLEKFGSWLKIIYNLDDYKGYIKNKKFPPNYKNTHKISVLFANLYTKPNKKGVRLRRSYRSSSPKLSHIHGVPYRVSRVLTLVRSVCHIFTVNWYLPV